jgi:hypothetical protein
MRLENQIATKQDFQDLEYRLLLRLGGMITVAIGIVAAVVKLIKP